MCKLRSDNRSNTELRPVTFEKNPLKFSQGSVVISTGLTKVLCTATVEEKVPKFLMGTGQAWVTAEYSMLPGSTSPRVPRDNQRKGRSQEISRLIGRSLRAAINLQDIGEFTITIDCDVLQADGGTRTASITGGFVALNMAVKQMFVAGSIDSIPDITPVAATSVGILGDQVLVDLCYEEDSKADADFNIVMASDGGIVEIQGSAEGNRFSRRLVDNVLDSGIMAIAELFKFQIEALN
ncbi:MAG: ribonuclease PH [SAR202 cluster bacterium]|nr:MAG: ribonuclease PH [SAR202 cluster bacterium]KAA1304369.1 MAG: ribonuclease PH [SAR202 cluster bacterium]MEE3345435.1 ribonuclease PH [Chloroflexota bacterium]